MLGRTDSRLRMVAILLLFSFFAAAAGVRLGYWQVVAADELTAQVQRSGGEAERLVRADIVDRNDVVLAKTASYDSLDAYPELIDPDDREIIVDTLVSLLDLDRGDRTAYLEALAEGGSFARLDRSLTLEESERIQGAIDERLLPGITLTPHPSRTYPRGGPAGAMTSLASQVIGYVRGDLRGGSGVEQYYEKQLTEVDPGTLEMASVDVSSLDLQDIEPPPLRLTIDHKLQRQVEKELHHAQSVNKARSASAILMDPHTGAILAMASYPSYDANDFASLAATPNGIRQLRNPVVSDQYEPGSVMKMFTVTAAYHHGKVTPNTWIKDSAQLRIYDDIIRNADKGSLGRIRVKDVIAESRNVATSKIARRLARGSHQKAAHRLFDMWKRVGMTDRTGIDVAAEADGTWYDPSEYAWAEVDLANRSFGQGVAVTLLHLARGYSTFVNGGYRIQPHVVADGEAAQAEPVRVLKPKVARQAKDLLRYVTGSVPRYAQRTLVRGYDIGGKTGTAQIWDPKKWNKETQQRGDHKDRRFNHSFVGFVGGREQEVVIAVRIEEPVPVFVDKRLGVPLELESTELFRVLARAAIKQLDMKKVRDPGAGRPIIGTDAAKRLDPVRNREAQKEKRREARREERKAARAAEADGVDTNDAAGDATTGTEAGTGERKGERAGERAGSAASGST